MKEGRWEEILECISTTCDAFLNAISDGIYLLDREGNVLYVNRAVEETAGIPAEKLVGLYHLDVVPAQERERLEKIFDRVIRGEAVAPYEVCYTTPGGDRRYVELNSQPVVRDGQIVGVQGVSRDITSRKRAETVLKEMNLELELRAEKRTLELVRSNRNLENERDALKRSDEALRALFNAVTEVVFLVNTDGTLVALNDAAAARFGVAAETAVGTNLKELLEPEVLERRREQARPAVESGEPVIFEDTRQGRVFRTSVYPVKASDGTVLQLAVFGLDITAQKAAEKKLLAHQGRLRSLASQLSLAEERQRRRIAVEVHDQVGQSLAFAKMKLAELDAETSSDHTLAVAEEVSLLIDGAIQKSRTLVSELGSPVLYELGFVPAVEGLCREMEGHRGGPLTVRFEDDGKTKPLARDVQVLLFQSLRELLANCLKHARARIVEVALAVQDGWLNVSVEDDGVGFDRKTLNSAVQEEQSFGLFSIQQRLESMGGELKIVSVPGEGTGITMQVPLQSETNTSN